MQGDAEPTIAGCMRELATLLESHVRLEERRLFPLIETLLPEETLTALANTAAPKGSGPVWGTESEELNATLLSLACGRRAAGACQ